MIVSLLAPFGVVGFAAGLFGLYLARMLMADGNNVDAAATRHNARLMLVAGGTLLLVALGGAG